MVWYYNPATGHYQYAAAPPGTPWIVQSPTLTSYSISPTSGNSAGGD